MGSLIVYTRKMVSMLKIYDFYDNFSSIYPIDKDSLKSPDRDQIGYYWDFEDYFIKGEVGRGLVIQGILLTDEKDFIFFKGLFQQAFRMTVINSSVKAPYVSSMGDFIDEFIPSSHLKNNYFENVIENFSEAFESKTDSMNSFFDLIKSKLKRGKIWIPLNNYWTDLIKSDTEKIWGDDIRVLRLPDEYLAMNRKDLWEELHELGPLEFNIDMAWEDLSYASPELVNYMDKDILERIDTGFLGNCHKYGIL